MRSYYKDKDYQKKYQKKYREKNRDKLNHKMRECFAEKRKDSDFREKEAERYAEWYNKNGRERSEKDILLIKIYQKQHPERVKAASRLNYAVEAGTISKPKICSSCNKSRKIHGHHEDYSKPLDVIWLCVSCHKKLHNNIGKEIR